MNKEDIKRKCLEYDKEWGRYPESPLEGFSVFSWIIGKKNEDKDFYEWEKKVKKLELEPDCKYIKLNNEAKDWTK